MGVIINIATTLKTPVALGYKEVQECTQAGVIRKIDKANKHESAAILASWKGLSQSATLVGLHDYFKYVTGIWVDDNGQAFIEMSDTPAGDFNIQEVLQDGETLIEYAAPEQLGVSLPEPPVSKPFVPNYEAQDYNTDSFDYSSLYDEEDEGTVVDDNYDDVPTGAIQISLPQYDDKEEPYFISENETFVIRRRTRNNFVDDGSTIVINPLYDSRGIEISKKVSRNQAEISVDNHGDVYVRPSERSSSSTSVRYSNNSKYTSEKILDRGKSTKIDTPASIWLGNAVELRVEKNGVA